MKPHPPRTIRRTAGSADTDALKRRIAIVVPLLALGPALLMIVVFWAVL